MARHVVLLSLLASLLMIVALETCRLPEGHASGACLGLGVGGGPPSHDITHSTNSERTAHHQIRAARRMSDEKGKLMACIVGVCNEDKSQRNIRQLPVADIGGRHASLFQPSDTNSRDDTGNTPHSLISFLALSSDTLETPKWFGGELKPTAVFEAGRFRVVRSEGQSEVEVTIPFENREYDPRMAPVVVASTVVMRMELSDSPLPVIHANIIAVSNEGFMAVVGSPFHTKNFDDNLIIDLTWYAYGFTTLHDHPSKNGDGQLYTLHPEASIWKA